MNKQVGLVIACIAANGSLSAQVLVNDLYDELDSGRVRLVSATGNGSSSGASIEGYLINDTAAERHVGIYLSRPIYLANSGAGQNMVATEVYSGNRGYLSDGQRSFLTLSPGVRTRVLLIAYCVDFEKDNPTTKDRMTVRAVPSSLKTVMSNIGVYVRANPEAEVTAAAQLAIWLVQGVEITAIRSKFTFTPADERLARTFYPLAGQRPRSASEGEAAAAECFSDIPRCKELARTGDAEAQSDFGLLYLKGQGIAQDDTEAAHWFRLAAEQGHRLAQNNLGEMYAGGYGVVKDYVEAVRWYRLGAAQGHSTAEFNLGVAYSDGRGVPRNEAEALDWFRKSANAGHPNAQTNLGAAYLNGDGVTQDHSQALMWYRRAAEQGDMKAQSNIGLIYANGQGVPRDDAKALGWFQRAADSGFADGMYNLGVMIAQGRGGPANLVRALMWLEVAVLHGNQDAPRARVVVASNMNDADIAEAKKLAEDWRPR